MRIPLTTIALLLLGAVAQGQTTEAGVGVSPVVSDSGAQSGADSAVSAVEAIDTAVSVPDPSARTDQRLEEIDAKLDILRRDQNKIKARLRDDSTKAAAAPAVTPSGDEKLLIGWGEGFEGEQEGLRLRLTPEGVVLERRETGDELEVEWELDEGDERGMDREKESRGSAKEKGRRGLVALGEKLRFGDLKSKPDFGISYTWMFVAGEGGPELSNQYSFDILLARRHEISFIFGHGLGLSDGMAKWRGSYQFLLGKNTLRMGVGMEAGFGYVDRESSSSEYSYYSGYTTTYETSSSETVFGPKLSWGVWLDHFHIEIENVMTFAPDFMNEVGLGFGVIF
jgi:hypothetical protein